MRLSSMSRFAVAILIFCCGCFGGAPAGPELTAVTGVVKVDGRPTPKLSITFVPEGAGGVPSYGGTDSEGRFVMMFSQDRKGAMPGKHQVTIASIESQKDDNGKFIDPADEGRPMYQFKTRQIEVQPGGNDIEITLDSKTDVKKGGRG